MSFFGDKHKIGRSGGAPVDTLIGAQMVVRGDVQFSGGLYVEGRLHGAVQAEPGAQAMLTIAEQGLIEGEVRVPVAVINGRLHGDLYASERVELAANARVEGNIYYAVIEMAAGAMITGRLIHQPAAVQAALPSPAALRREAATAPALAHEVVEPVA